MSHRRMIDPLIWEDEHFGLLSDKAKILFMACISNADDDGRLNANPSHIRAIAFRYEENISIKTIEELIKELEDKLKNFKVYSVNGSSYIQLLKWYDYQTIRSDRYKPSKIPEMEGWKQFVTEMYPEWQPDDNHLTTIGKRRLDKSSIDKSSTSIENKNLLYKEIISYYYKLQGVEEVDYKKLPYGRLGTACKKLFHICDGKKEEVLKLVKHVSDWATKKGLSWTLETCITQYPFWQKEKKESNTPRYMPILEHPAQKKESDNNGK